MAAAVLVTLRDGTTSVSQYGLGMRQFLLDHPPGAYTLLRTCGRSKIVQLSGHIRRLARSAQRLKFGLPADASPSDQEPANVASLVAPARNESSLRSKLVPLLRRALDAFHEQQQTPQAQQQDFQEAKMVVLVTVCVDEQSGLPHLFIGVHCDPLAKPDTARPASVVVYGRPRINPAAKSTAWISDRKYIEQARPSDCQESILADDQGRLYEGTVTNFAVLVVEQGDDGSQGVAIITAPVDGVLEGMSLLILQEACRRLGIPFRWEHLSIHTTDTWQSAFILNVPRIISPVASVRIDESQTITLSTDSKTTAEDI
ncbi:aminotransferase [Entophlyctis helioformis]|nr:aminotransferase [Entophlyctis helioformis]